MCQLKHKRVIPESQHVIFGSWQADELRAIMREIMEPFMVRNDNLIQKIDRSMEQNDKLFSGLIAEIKDLNATMRADHVRWDAAIAEMRANSADIHAIVEEMRVGNAEIRAMVGEMRVSNAEIHAMVEEVRVSNAEIHAMVEEVRALRTGVAPSP